MPIFLPNCTFSHTQVPRRKKNQIHTKKQKLCYIPLLPGLGRQQNGRGYRGTSYYIQQHMQIPSEGIYSTHPGFEFLARICCLCIIQVQWHVVHLNRTFAIKSTCTLQFRSHFLSSLFSFKSQGCMVYDQTFYWTTLNSLFSCKG